MLTEVGIPSLIEEVPNAGHDFYPGYEDALLRGLESIQDEEA